MWSPDRHPQARAIARIRILYRKAGTVRLRDALKLCCDSVRGERLGTEQRRQACAVGIWPSGFRR